MANDGVKIAAAAAAGYLVGRTKKARLVFALAGGVAMAGRGLVVLGLDQNRLRGVLTEVVADVQRSMAGALSSRAERMSDNLRAQTARLGGGDEDRESGDGHAEEGGEATDGDTDQEQPRDEAESGDDDQAEAPRTPSRRRASPQRGRGDREPEATGRGRR